MPNIQNMSMRNDGGFSSTFGNPPGLFPETPQPFGHPENFFSPDMSHLMQRGFDPSMVPSYGDLMANR